MVWSGARRNIVITALYCVAFCSCTVIWAAHRFCLPDLASSHWVHSLCLDYFVCARLFSCIISACMLHYSNTVRWAYILRPVWVNNHPPSVLWHCWLGHQTCNKKAVLPQGNRAMPQVFFSVEVRQQHSLQKTSQASKVATLQSWRKTQFNTKSGFKSIKVTCLESVEKQWSNK